MDTRRTPLHDEADLLAAVAEARHLVFLTGAGISAAAGIATFRGPSGLYGDGEITAPVYADDLVGRPNDVAAWHNARQEEIARAEPTRAHRAIATAAIEVGRLDGSVTVVTMNGDDLHEKAGTPALHLHGSFLDARCDPCARLEPRTPIGTPCPLCGEAMRPNVVAFGEKVDSTARHTALRALNDADLFIGVGLSGQTMTPLGLAADAAAAGVPTVAITLDPSRSVRRNFELCLDVEADRLTDLLAGVGSRLGGVPVPAGSLSARIAEVTLARCDQTQSADNRK